MEPAEREAAKSEGGVARQSRRPNATITGTLPIERDAKRNIAGEGKPDKNRGGLRLYIGVIQLILLLECRFARAAVGVGF